VGSTTLRNATWPLEIVGRDVISSFPFWSQRGDYEGGLNFKIFWAARSSLLVLSFFLFSFFFYLGVNFLRATFEAFSSLRTNIILAGIWMNVALTFACSFMTKASNVPTTIDYLISSYSLKSKLSVRLFLCALLFFVFNLDIWMFTVFK